MAIFFKACWKIRKMMKKEPQSIFKNWTKYLRVRGFTNTMLLVYWKNDWEAISLHCITTLHKDKILNIKGLIFSINITKVALKAESGSQTKLDTFFTMCWLTIWTDHQVNQWSLCSWIKPVLFWKTGISKHNLLSAVKG